MGLSGAQYLLRFICSAACVAFTRKVLIKLVPQLLKTAKKKGKVVKFVCVDTMCYRYIIPGPSLTSVLLDFCEELRALDAYPAFFDDELSNVKVRNTADYTAHQVEALDVFRAAEGANSDVVRALPGSGSSDAHAAAERLRSGDAFSAPAPP